MGILLCEQNFRDVWRRNKSVGQKFVKFCAHTHKHTHAAKLVVRMFVLYILHYKTVGSTRMFNIDYYNCQYTVSCSIFNMMRDGENLGQISLADRHDWKAQCDHSSKIVR